MKTRAILVNTVLVVLCVVTATSPSWAAEYVAADAPTSLADGKLAIEYDGTGKISELRMTPDVGETLVLSGDTLDFAADARLMPGQNGISCISNDITCAGTLQIGMTNMSYNGSLLSKTDYTTMFTDVRLDDISPISVNMSGVSATGGGMYYPYHVTRDGDTMRMEIKTVHDGYIKCVYLELKQDGNDIAGKILNNGNYNNNAANFIGVSLFENPVVTPTSYNYGLKQLTIGPRREEYEYTGGLISENGTVVAESAQLDDLEIKYAFSGLPGKYNGCPRMTSYPSHVKYENGVLSAQFQMVDSGSLKCVKLAFSQVGADVVANYVYAKYVSTYDATHEYDFDTEGTEYKFLTKELYAENASTYGYGIDMVALRHKSKNRLLLPVPDLRNIDMPLAGGGCEIIFDSGKNEAAPVESNVTKVDPALYGTTYTTLTTEYALKDIVITGGRIGGSWCNKSTGRDSLVVDWKNNGKTASCQIHALDGTAVKGVDVELRQNDGAVEIRCKQAIYHETKADEYFGVKRVVPGVDGGTTQTLSTSATTKAYALLWVEWDRLPRPRAAVFATAANSMADTMFTIRGDETRPLEFLVLNTSALPAGSTECWGDSGLHIAIAAAFGHGISGGKSAMVMHPGSRLYQSGAQSFYVSGQSIVLDAADLYPLYLTENVCYANTVTLSNGAHVCEGKLQAGYYANPAVWTVCGTGVVTNESDLLVLSRYAASGERQILFDVADTVAGDEVDFVQNGDITHHPDYIIGTFIKSGPGTMLMNGTISTTNAAPRIKEGTLLLNKSGAVLEGVDFDLMGGTLALAAGTANTVSAVDVTEDSGISLGAGASLTLANVTVTEDKTLAIEYAGDIDSKGVKVNAALDAATLSRITLNGKHARQSSEGYLYCGGFILIVR